MNTATQPHTQHVRDVVLALSHQRACGRHHIHVLIVPLESNRQAASLCRREVGQPREQVLEQAVQPHPCPRCTSHHANVDIGEAVDAQPTDEGAPSLVPRTHSTATHTHSRTCSHSHKDTDTNTAPRIGERRVWVVANHLTTTVAAALQDRCNRHLRVPPSQVTQRGAELSARRLLLCTRRQRHADTCKVLGTRRHADFVRGRVIAGQGQQRCGGVVADVEPLVGCVEGFGHGPPMGLRLPRESRLPHCMGEGVRQHAVRTQYRTGRTNTSCAGAAGGTHTLES